MWDLGKDLKYKMWLFNGNSSFSGCLKLLEASKGASIEDLTGAVSTSRQLSNSWPPQTSLTETEEQEDEEQTVLSTSNFNGLLLSLTISFWYCTARV